MSEPSREHVEAVARVTNPGDWSARKVILARAEAILTSTDPAVLDALQDALVRAGRLTDEPSPRPARRSTSTASSRCDPVRDSTPSPETGCCPLPTPRREPHTPTDTPTLP